MEHDSITYRDRTAHLFFPVYNAFLDNHLCDLSGSAVKAFLAIYRYVGIGKREATIPMKDILRTSGLSENTAYQAMQELEDRQILHRESEKGSPTAFTVRQETTSEPTPNIGVSKNDTPQSLGHGVPQSLWEGVPQKPGTNTDSSRCKEEELAPPVPVAASRPENQDPFELHLEMDTIPWMEKYLRENRGTLAATMKWKGLNGEAKEKVEAGEGILGREGYRIAWMRFVRAHPDGSPSTFVWRAAEPNSEYAKFEASRQKELESDVAELKAKCCLVDLFRKKYPDCTPEQAANAVRKVPKEGVDAFTADVKAGKVSPTRPVAEYQL